MRQMCIAILALGLLAWVGDAQAQEAESAAECRRLGAYAYLTKPFKPQDLVQMVRLGLPEGRQAC